MFKYVSYLFLDGVEKEYVFPCWSHVEHAGGMGLTHRILYAKLLCRAVRWCTWPFPWPATFEAWGPRHTPRPSHRTLARELFVLSTADEICDGDANHAIGILESCYRLARKERMRTKENVSYHHILVIFLV